MTELEKSVGANSNGESKREEAEKEWEPSFMESIGFHGEDVGTAIKTVASTALASGAVVGVVWATTRIIVRGMQEINGQTEDEEISVEI